MATFTIPTSKSPLLDPNTSLITRDWFIYLNNLLNAVGSGTIGTTTQVLHGGGTGYSQVNLTSDVTQVLPGVNGGTGVSNALKTITLGGNLTISGSSSVIISVTGASSIVFPLSGQLLVSPVTNAQLDQMTARTIKGNNTAVTAIPTDLSAGQFPATQTNDSASSGNLGEYLSSTVSSVSSVGLTSTVVANVTNVVLTPGDWDVTGQVDYTSGGGTVIQYMQQGANTVSAVLPSQDGYSSSVLGATVVTDPGNPIPTSRISITSTTTTYLIVKSSFSISTLSAYGTIRARRMR